VRLNLTDRCKWMPQSYPHPSSKYETTPSLNQTKTTAHSHFCASDHQDSPAWPSTFWSFRPTHRIARVVRKLAANRPPTLPAKPAACPAVPAACCVPAVPAACLLRFLPDPSTVGSTRLQPMPGTRTPRAAKRSIHVCPCSHSSGIIQLVFECQW
jgi:hypothetical protein